MELTPFLGLEKKNFQHVQVASEESRINLKN